MRPAFQPGRPPLPGGAKPCPCCQWRAHAEEHSLGLCVECRVCLHCGDEPTTSLLGLCAACEGNSCVRHLYARDREFDPAWEQHLRQLTRWYQAQLQTDLEKVPRSECCSS